MSVNLNNTAQRIIYARKQAGISQRDLAEFTGLSQPTLHRIEAGSREVSSIELSLIADACGVLVADLLGTNRIEEQVRCAGRTNDEGSKMIADYLMYALGVDQRLEQLGVPEQL